MHCKQCLLSQSLWNERRNSCCFVNLQKHRNYAAHYENGESFKNWYTLRSTDDAKNKKITQWTMSIGQDCWTNNICISVEYKSIYLFSNHVPIKVLFFFQLSFYLCALSHGRTSISTCESNVNTITLNISYSDSNLNLDTKQN